MKKLFFACLTFSIFACNNQSSNSKENGKAVATASENASATASCGSLILFHKGAVIENTTYDAAGKETNKQTTTVNDVKEEGGMLVASSSALMPGKENKTFSMNYKCDGTNLYMDIASMLQNFEGLNKLKGDVKPIAFPLNISVGQTLPDASYTMSMDRGAVKMDITASFKNRTVSAKENITTTAGSWDCFKINTDIESDVQGLDEQTKKIMDAMKDKMKMNMVMYYSPKIGVVRTEMFQNGKLNTRSDITAVKD